MWRKKLAFHSPSELHYEVYVNHTKDGNKTTRYDHNSNFCNRHNSLHYHEITTNLHRNNDIIEPYNVQLNVKDELVVVDSCHEAFFFYIDSH